MSFSIRFIELPLFWTTLQVPPIKQDVQRAEVLKIFTSSLVYLKYEQSNGRVQSSKKDVTGLLLL